jgi:hypothetical protein
MQCSDGAARILRTRKKEPKMQNKQNQPEETPKKPEQKPTHDQRKPYTAPKLKVHGSLGQITAGSGKHVT